MPFSAPWIMQDNPILPTQSFCLITTLTEVVSGTTIQPILEAQIGSCVHPGLALWVG